MEMFLTIKLCTYAKQLFSIELIIYIKMDLVLNNLQRLICHKTKQTKPFMKCFNFFLQKILFKI